MGSETTTPQSSTGLYLASTTTNFTGSERADGLNDLERERLLPLSPDEITTTLIIPRLSWRAIMSSSQLNSAWRAALRSPLVHKLRAQAITSQTIVTVPPFDCTVSLYDTATRTWHRHLPHIPLDGTPTGTGHRCLPCIPLDGNVTRGLRRCLPSIPLDGGGCVTLEGKLYIIEGYSKLGGKIHVFDVAGQGQWKECARMKHARRHFACEAFEGKIYVFGGARAGQTAEVYDPEQDKWSDLAPMLSHRIGHKVVIIGDVFCVHMGTLIGGAARWEYPQFAEIYDPRTDNWTKVANFAINIDHTSKGNNARMAEAAVVIGGRLHGILDDWLYVYEEPLNCSQKTLERLRWDGSGSWKAVQPISWDVFHPTSPTRNHDARHAVAISNYGELFAVVLGPTCTCCPNHSRKCTGPTCTCCPNHSRQCTGPRGLLNLRRQWTLLESKGLGAVGETLTWQRILEGPTLSLHPDYFQFPPYVLSMAGPW